MIFLLAIIPFLPLALGQATVYLIRHGEKPSSGNGLNAQGMQRAQCLRQVFGASSGYNIDYILAQQYKADGSRKRPFDTVTPLAHDLGLTVDVHCDRDDPDCVQDAVKAHTGSGNILICWEHDALHDIAKELGDKDAPKYPSGRFDLIWEDPFDYKDITNIYSENCPGLDG